MVKEIMAKLNPNEKLIGVGAVVILVGFILGLVLTSDSVFGSWYGTTGAEGLGLIAVVAGVAAVVVIYLKYAPNMKIAWPAPLPLIMLVISGVAGIAALLGLLEAVTGNGYCVLGLCAAVSKPITLYLAAGVVVVGAALMTYAAYLDYQASSKTPAA